MSTEILINRDGQSYDRKKLWFSTYDGVSIGSENSITVDTKEVGYSDSDDLYLALECRFCDNKAFQTIELKDCWAPNEVTDNSGNCLFLGVCENCRDTGNGRGEESCPQSPVEGTQVPLWGTLNEEQSLRLYEACRFVQHKHR